MAWAEKAEEFDSEGMRIPNIELPYVPTRNGMRSILS
jgi:hypothetical protein